LPQKILGFSSASVRERRRRVQSGGRYLTLPALRVSNIRGR
jgi:hypothetical protein